jgi:hypothetical protein
MKETTSLSIGGPENPTVENKTFVTNGHHRILFSVDKDMIDDSSNDVHTAASQEDITVEATEVIYCAICTFPPEVPNPPFLD